jgi:hypothetical protein
MASLDRQVEESLARLSSLSLGATRRTVRVKLTPCEKNEKSKTSGRSRLERWTLSSGEYGRKYVLLPISEAIPAQRPASSEADDRYRTADRVCVRAVRLKIVLQHVQPVRLLLFAFRNDARGESAADVENRPYVDAAVVGDSSGAGRPMSELLYDVLTKEELLGKREGKEVGQRHMPLLSGPLRSTRVGDSGVDWDGTDGTAFTTWMNTSKGGLAGKVYVREGTGPNRRFPRFYRKTFNCGSTSGGVGGFYRHLDVFVGLNEQERYVSSSSSQVMSGRPLELFLGVDCPADLDGSSVSSGCVASATMEIEYS